MKKTLFQLLFIVLSLAVLPAAASADERELSPDAKQLVGEELVAFLGDMQGDGKYLWNGEWFRFHSTYAADGKVTSSGSDWLVNGSWVIQDDDIVQFSWDGDEYPKEYRKIYLDTDGVYKAYDPEDNRVESYWTTLSPF